MSEAVLSSKLAAAWPPAQWRDLTVLVAVSGGADSVALARALAGLKEGKGRLILAHFNHRLRGAESDADEAFVHDLGVRLGLATASAAGDAPLSEAALRDERYAFLTRTAAAHGARFVATAHTADDQVETILFNAIRGTGLKGLAGIPRIRPLNEATTLVRPLLGVTRCEVLAYLGALGQGYRDDATNVQLHFARNRIRHNLLPLLEREFNPEVREALLRLGHIASEASDVIDTQTRDLFEKTRRPIPGGVELETLPLGQSPKLVARAALIQAWREQNWPLQDMGFEKWDQLLAFATAVTEGGATAQPPRQMYPGGVLAERAGSILRLTRAQDA